MKTNVYKNIKHFLVVFFLLLTTPLFATITGSGTASEPYIIYNTTDWNTFANNVNNGINADKYYKLSDSFNNSSSAITTMAGNSPENPFRGVFDGNGRTLTINLSSTEDYVAPFRYANGVTIENLTITGSISTSKMFAGGFISNPVGGMNRIEGCVSSVTITSSVNGDGSHGGFIGISDENSNIVFTDCAFVGSLKGDTTSHSSGFLGFRRGKCSYSNCLFAPASITMLAAESAIFNRNWTGDIENSYYKTRFGEDQGLNAKSMTNEELCDALGLNWEIRGGKVLPIQGNDFLIVANVTGVSSKYAYTGASISIDYTVSFYSNNLVKDTDYRESIINSNGETVNTLLNKGKYKLVLEGIGIYRGTKEIPFMVGFGGLGTEENPYIIETTDDWNELASFVNDTTANNTYEGCYFKLTSDLDFGGVKDAFTAIAVGGGCSGDGWGARYDHVRTNRIFSGIFDGNNHTIRGVYYTDGGLFGKITESAVIKNITLQDSTIIGTYRIGGIVCINSGKIINCHVTDDVYVYSGMVPNAYEAGYAGNFSHGGIVGDNFAEGTVEGCTSAATVKAKHNSNNFYGGIAGYNSGTIKHCLYYGKEVIASSDYGAICGNFGGTFELCLDTYAARGALNGSDTSNAAFANKIAIHGTDVSLNINSSDTHRYGLITAVSGVLIMDNTIYAPSGYNLSIDFKYTGGKIAVENLTYAYQYKSNSQNIVETCTRNQDGTYSFIMPSADVTFFAGYGWSGEGTQQNPYLITNLAQMQFLATIVNEAGKDYSGEYFKLPGDIQAEINQNNYISIGGFYDGNYRDFCGIFDGAGYSISGVNITKTGMDDSNKYQGLFGRLGADAVIKNLTLKNSTIKGYFSVGGFAGYNNGTITNCKVMDNVLISSNNSGASCHGGITGYNEGTISNCQSFAKVKNSSMAGGITGYDNGGSISSCQYFLTENNFIKADSSYAGFIIGYYENGLLIKNLYVGTGLSAIGSVTSGNDIAGAKKAYEISSLSGTISFTTDSQGYVYNSKLYSTSGETVKLMLTGISALPNTFLGLQAVDQNNDNIIFDSIENGVYIFTMPAYDVTVGSLAKVNFDTTGGVPVQDQLIIPGNKVKQVPAPTSSSSLVFDDWYLDATFKTPFSFDTPVAENLTLYAHFSPGRIIDAQKDPHSDQWYYTTFYSTKCNYKADGMSFVYYVTKNADGKLSIQREESRIINAGTGVIIQSLYPEVSLVKTDEKGVYTYGNILTGTDEEITAPEDAYVMGYGPQGGVGFYKWTGTIDANKAFLKEENDE